VVARQKHVRRGPQVQAQFVDRLLCEQFRRTPGCL
jgi:hypothetical protein